MDQINDAPGDDKESLSGGLQTPLRTASGWKGAAVGLAWAAALVWAWAELPALLSSFQLTSLLLTVITLVIVAGVSFLLSRLLGRLGMSAAFTWAFIAAALLFVSFGAGSSLRGWLLTFALLVIAASVLGAVVTALKDGSWDRWATPRRVIVATGLTGSLLILISGTVWLLTSGPAAPDTVDAMRLNATNVKDPTSDEVAVPDPAAQGDHGVRQLTYGSGNDHHRVEYGDEVTVVTDSVDASALLSGWSGLTGWSRTRYWGFDETALPVNGRVWYPDGEGPFPLVILVHGDSQEDQFSDGGFAYLGELLATRGFIVASIYANFLNTTASDGFGGLIGAAPTRAWLIMEHLRVWHEWNEADGNPFAGMVDTDNIALLGHSRGGEAVAAAASFNSATALPDDPDVPFDYGYNLKAVIALAPVDGQYRPGGEPITLQNLSYLTVQGSHDADIRTFAGLNQYHRTELDPDQAASKAAVYISRANHTQFNSTWGRHDVGNNLTKRFISTTALLEPQQQRRIAQIYVSAFLEATLHGDSVYRAVFTQPQSAQTWRPDTIVLTQYSTADAQDIANFDEDDDPASITLPEGQIEGLDLTEMTEAQVPMRVGTTMNRAIRISWNNQATSTDPSVSLVLPPGSASSDATTRLQFDLADATSASPTTEEDARETLILPTVEVQDRDGTTSTLPPDQFTYLQPQINGRYLKAGFLHDTPTSEPILQTFTYPLQAFADAEGEFDPATVSRITIRFTEATTGVVFLDEVALVSPSALK